MTRPELRSAVLEAFRRRRVMQWTDLEPMLKEIDDTYSDRHDHEVWEIVWELIVERVLSPGVMSSHFSTTEMHVTTYGTQVLESDKVSPHDPTRYLSSIEESVGAPIDEVVMVYVREALHSFLVGHYLSSAVMLGVASERCIDILVDALLDATSDATQRADFKCQIGSAGRSVKRRFDVLRERLLSRTLPPELADALDIQLSGVFTLLRYTRNEAGHPTGVELDRDSVHGNLLLFPAYCKRVYGLLEHLSSAGKASSPGV